jgi:hypothetical protein
MMLAYPLFIAARRAAALVFLYGCVGLMILGSLFFESADGRCRKMELEIGWDH